MVAHKNFTFISITSYIQPIQMLFSNNRLTTSENMYAVCTILSVWIFVFNHLGYVNQYELYFAVTTTIQLTWRNVCWICCLFSMFQEVFQCFISVIGRFSAIQLLLDIWLHSLVLVGQLHSYTHEHSLNLLNKHKFPFK